MFCIKALKKYRFYFYSLLRQTFLCPGETEYLHTPEDLWSMRAVVECQVSGCSFQVN